MPDRRLRALVLALVGALLLGVALPAVALAGQGRQAPDARITIADVPGTGGEDCVDDPDAQPGVGLRECPKGFQIATLLPFIAGGVAVLLALAVGWYLVMRRRAARPFLPDEAAGAVGGSVGGSGGGPGSSTVSGEWWTCRNCGKTNMVGSARCYSCGSWQR